MTEPPVWLPSASGSMPAATAAAEPDDEPPGVCARLRGLRVSRGLERREFGGDGLAEDDAAGAPDQHDHRGIGLRPVAGIDRRAVGGRQVGRVEDVLDADRKPAQRLARASCGASARCRAASISSAAKAPISLLVRGDRLARRDRSRRAARRAPASMRRARSRAESIRPGRRSARRSARSTRRAGGTMKNAVVAATGQAMSTGLHPAVAENWLGNRDRGR